MILKHHIYTTRDRSRVVEEDDPDVGVLLYAAGDDIPDAEVKRLGLDKPTLKGGREAKKAEAAPQAKAVDKADEGVEDKAVAGPGAKPAAKG